MDRHGDPSSGNGLPDAELGCEEPLEEFFDALQEDVERATLETCQSSGSTFVTPVLRPRPGPLSSAPSILGSFSRNSSCSSVYHDALSEWELEALDAPVKAQLAHPLGWGRVVQPVILCKEPLSVLLSFLSMGFCLCHGDWHRGQREAERLPLLLIACFLGAFTASFLSPRLQQLAATAATALLGLRRSQSRRPYALLLDWACAGVAVSSVLSAAAAAPLRRPGWLGFQLALGISAALWGLQLATALPPTALPAATLLSIFLHLIAQLCLQGGCGPIIHVAPMDSLAEKASMLQELKRMRLQVWQAVQEPWFLATSIAAASLGVGGRHLGGLEALTLSTGDPPQLAIVLLLSLATLPGFLAAASYGADWSEARSLRWSFATLGVGFSLLHPGHVPSVGEEGEGDWAHLTDGILSASAVGRGLLLHLLFASFAQALACIGQCCLGAVPKGHMLKQTAWRPVALAVVFCAFFCDAAAARIFESRSRWLSVASANFLAAVACASFPQSSRRSPPLSEWAEGYAGLRDLRPGRQRLDSRDSRLRAGVVGGLRRLSARFLPARKKDLLDPAFVNCILAELWPSLRGMLEEDVVKGEFQQILQNVTAALKFDRICLGPEPLKVLSLSMVPATSTERAITIAAEVEFSGKDVDLTLSLTLGRLVGLSVSVNRFSLRGSLLLSFRYLTPHLPLTQGLTIAFVNPPAVDLSLRTPAGSLPFLPERARQALIALVDSTIARDLVLPNRLPLPFGTLWPLERLQHARPEGVLFCRVLGACGVTAERNSFGAERAVRCCLSLGAATWRSVAAHSEDGELIWDEQPTFVVDAFSSQELRIALHECHTFSDRQSGQVKALPLEELVERSKHQHMPSWALQAAGSASGLGSPQILLSAIFHPVSRQRASFDKKLGSLVMITVDCARRIPDAFAGRRLAVRAFLATDGRPANGDRPAIQSYSLRASYVLPLHAATGILERLLLCNFTAPTSTLGDSSDEDPHGTKPYQGYLKSEEARWRDRLSNLWSLLSADGRDLAEWLDSDRAGCIKSIALILDLPVWAEQRLGEVMDEMRQAQFAARRVWARRRGTAEAPVTTRALECCWRQQLRLVASSPQDQVLQLEVCNVDQRSEPKVVGVWSMPLAQILQRPRMTVPMASYPLRDPDQQQVDAEASPAPAEPVEPFSLHLKLEMLHLRSSDGRRGQPT